jgi:hypothetical protein
VGGLSDLAGGSIPPLTFMTGNLSESDSDTNGSIIDDDDTVRFNGYIVRHMERGFGDGDGDITTEDIHYTDVDSSLVEVLRADRLYRYVREDHIDGSNIVSTDLEAELSQISLCSKWDFKTEVPNEIVNPDRSIVNFDNYGPIIKNSSEFSFPNRLSLRYITKSRLLDLNNVRKYKNNLSCIISHETCDYLVVAESSELVFFQFDSETQAPLKYPCLVFDTRPMTTFTTDRLVSTWPRFPHAVNTLKSFTNFCGEKVLVSCCDDGCLMVWLVSTLTKHMKKLDLSLNTDIDDDENFRSHFMGLKVKPDLKLKLEASVWGVDCVSYHDKFDSTHTLLVTSDNSQTVTLFYYHEADKQFTHVKSQKFLHNIPDVSFISHKIVDSNHVTRVTCASISEELITLEFEFQLVLGPILKPQLESAGNCYYVDPQIELFENLDRNNVTTVPDFNRFARALFSDVKIIARVLVGDFCWTTKPIKKKYFMSVSSIAEVFGNTALDDATEVSRITKESIILNLLYDPTNYSDLGMAGLLQYFECKTMELQQPRENDDTKDIAKLDDQYRNIRRSIYTIETKINLESGHYRLQKEVDMDFVVSTTAKRIGLFQLDSLFCNCSTGNLFDLRIPYNNDTENCDRISISHVIPNLLCLVAVYQLGLVSILRFCQYRGVYGFRQEHVFPNAMSLALCDSGYRTIVGLAVRNRSIGSLLRYVLYVIYSDGLVLSYELSTDLDSGDSPL